MMAHRIRQLPVVVTVHNDSQSARMDFVIVPKLVGEDTYLVGTLSVLSIDLKVRVLTLDNRTVLIPTRHRGPLPAALVEGARLEGMLVLRSPNGVAPLPADLDEELGGRGLNFALVDHRQQAYLLAFLAEARDVGIRQERIELICGSLAVVRDGGRS